MSVHEEYDKLNADSPALSVPSVAAASYASSPESSPEDESKNSSLRRTLFKMSNECDSLQKAFVKPASFVSSSNINSVIYGAVLIPDGGENGVTDTASITSSETTAIPSWNLSMKDATERNVEVPLNHFIISQPGPLLSSPPSFDSDQTHPPSLSSTSSFASDQTHQLDDCQQQLVFNEALAYSSEKVMDKENDHFKANQIKPPSVVVEEPPEETTSCNSALNLTPVQLAEIFLAFGQSARQRYQGSGKTGKSPTETCPEATSPIKVVKSTSEDPLMVSPPHIMTSSPLSESSSGSYKSQNSSGYSRVRSLERECDTLKVNTQRDAYKLLSLQHAVDTQKQLNSLKEVEIVDKQTELQISEQRVVTLQKEHEDYIERETELVETIEILKNELDKMTTLKSVPSDELDQLAMKSVPPFDKIETERFDMEMKSAASRAEAQQVRIAELENSLKEKEKENSGLQTKIDWLSGRQKGGSKDEQYCKSCEVEEAANLDGLGVTKDEDILIDPPVVEVESILKDIMKRLEAVEIEKKQKESAIIEQSKNNSEKMKNVKKTQELESDHDGVKVDISEDPEAIEATSLEENIENGADSDNQSTWCCDWSVISGE